MQQHVSEPPAPSTRPASIFIFDGMRMRSHLFFRYLSTSHELRPTYHPFLMAAWLGQERWAKGARCSAIRTKEIWEDMVPVLTSETFESLAAELESNVQLAEREGKIPLMNEHVVNVLRSEHLFALHRDPSYTLPPNPTHIPTAVFNSLTPIILLRHPILQTDSSYRSVVELGMQCRETDEDFELLQSTRLARVLFDMFTAQGRTPIVVEGEDLIYRTESLTKELCGRLGLDPSAFSEDWEPTPEEECPKHPMLRMFTTTIHASRGIERPDEQPDLPSLEKFYGKWTEKYGANTASGLKKIVEQNLTDYEYLVSHKI